VSHSRILFALAVIISLLLVTAIALFVTGLVANHRARQLSPERPRISATTPAVGRAPAPTPQPRVHIGRHREDNVRTVPATWRPPTGAARIRALEETRLDLNQPGGVA
jgi:hypothetical protein